MRDSSFPPTFKKVHLIYNKSEEASASLILWESTKISVSWCLMFWIMTIIVCWFGLLLQVFSFQFNCENYRHCITLYTKCINAHQIHRITDVLVGIHLWRPSSRPPCFTRRAISGTRAGQPSLCPAVLKASKSGNPSSSGQSNPVLHHPPSQERTLWTSQFVVCPLLYHLSLSKKIWLYCACSPVLVCCHQQPLPTSQVPLTVLVALQ